MNLLRAFHRIWLREKALGLMPCLNTLGAMLCLYFVIATVVLPSACNQPRAQFPECAPEKFFDGPGGDPIETRNYISIATMACNITVPAEKKLTLQFDHLIQRANLQMGSNTGSALEWDFCLDFEPPNEDTFSECLQYDKHADIAGNKTDTRQYLPPLHLPIGTVLTLRRRELPADYCTAKGDWAKVKAAGCFTGQRVDLVGVIE